jgi:hypothetical protein
MKTPAQWETWCDEFYTREKRYPWWHELITAVQEDALGSAPGSQGLASAAVFSDTCE